MRSLVIVSLILGICFATYENAEANQDLIWERISTDIVEVNSVLVDSQDPKIILIGTHRGVFRTEDAGNTWQAVLFGANKKVNFLYVDELNKNFIYAGCTCGLFFSHNQGRHWQRVYRGDSEEAANCLCLIKLNAKEIYLGTDAGLFRSQNNGRNWRKFPGRLGDLPIRAMTAGQTDRQIYLVTCEGAYKVKPDGQTKRIFVFLAADLQDVNEEFHHQINHICIDPINPEDIYLATSQGVVISNNHGRYWRRHSGLGLLSRKVDFIMVSDDSVPWVVSDCGVFVYNKDRWQELSLRLSMQDIRHVAVDRLGYIYIAGDKGLFRSAEDYQSVTYQSSGIKQEPTIQQVQEAAIKYAQVVDPQYITAHRRLSRLKAILPNFSLDYDKTISVYNNSTITRFSVGPRDWGASLQWNLGDLVWSEQQRLIDSQVRLMVKLRQDILDEVTRLYFERRRLQLEFISSQNITSKERQAEELRIEELTALLDGLTGGYLSKKCSGKDYFYDYTD